MIESGAVRCAGARHPTNRARSQSVNQRAAAAAFYQQAKVFRLKGEFVAAEEAYRGPSQLRLEPQPGLALLRLVQGRSDVAATAIRRVASTTVGRLKRMTLLPAHIEIMLAAGHVQDVRLPRAGGHCPEL
ncbi:hypothetical protein [Reyranella sp.]|uniref:hypothetical protein n=1 Tax=Reyranella sp. TaxID=1929291 RepID=UPI0012074F59|nr:hypothetical protein [Reyranella sp.]TAJ81419.1 MAG: hypothetical protein EPO50_31085 [Reyranella sp.]